jgi:hypothetical protein
MHRYRALCFALSCALLALSGEPLTTSASPSGLAWDSVTKIVMNADPSSLQPGDFASDFATAAAVQEPQQSGGGIFGQIRQSMGMGQSMAQMMQTGTAEHHYVAGSKERTDHLASQTATIVDCTARTITTLDLRRKTYTIVSMDQPASTSSGTGTAPASGASDNGSHVAISVTNTALGSRTVGGQPTNGYRSEVTFTATDSSGQSRTGSGGLTAYYSNYANPLPSCSGGSPAAGPRGPGAMMGGYARVMRALAAAGTDSRFSVTQSGPRLPLGMLAMYDAFTFGGSAQGQGATIVSERGNVRSIDASDPVFSIPAGFTAQQ